MTDAEELLKNAATKAANILHMPLGDIDLPCGELVDMIEQWLSDEIEYEYEDGDYDKGWNDALCTIKGKLR